MSVVDQAIQKKLDRQVALLVRHYRIDQRFLSFEQDITFSGFLSNKFLMISFIREGIPYSFFDLIQRITPFDENDWASFLDISTKSLHRYKEQDRQFKPLQSEKIIEMAEVTHIGLDVFSSMEKFKLWLDTPNYVLGNLRPIELLKDSYGKEMVVSELTRINYGILA